MPFFLLPFCKLFAVQLLLVFRGRPPLYTPVFSSSVLYLPKIPLTLLLPLIVQFCVESVCAKDLLSVESLRSFSASFSTCFFVLQCAFVVSQCLDRHFENLKFLLCLGFHLCVLCTPCWLLGPRTLPCLCRCCVCRCPLLLLTQTSRRVLCSLCSELCRSSCSRRRLCNCTRAPCPTSLAASYGPNHHCPCLHTATMSNPPHEAPDYGDIEGFPRLHKT